MNRNHFEIKDINKYTYMYFHCARFISAFFMHGICGIFCAILALKKGITRQRKSIIEVYISYVFNEIVLMKPAIKARLLTASLLVEGPEVAVCETSAPSIFSGAVRSRSLAFADLTIYKNKPK